MRILCQCGFKILDRTDNVAEKGHLIPDQEWCATFDAVDEAVINPLIRGEIGVNQALARSRTEI